MPLAVSRVMYSQKPAFSVGVTTFTTNQTWTVPARVRKIRATVTGIQWYNAFQYNIADAGLGARQIVEFYVTPGEVFYLKPTSGYLALNNGTSTHTQAQILILSSSPGGFAYQNGTNGPISGSNGGFAGITNGGTGGRTAGGGGASQSAGGSGGYCSAGNGGSNGGALSGGSGGSDGSFHDGNLLYAGGGGFGWFGGGGGGGCFGGAGGGGGSSNVNIPSSRSPVTVSQNAGPSTWHGTSAQYSQQTNWTWSGSQITIVF